MAIHEEGAYDDQPAVGGRLGLENTEAAARETLMLPIFPDLSEQEQNYVLERLAAHVLERAA